MVLVVIAIGIILTALFEICLGAAMVHYGDVTGWVWVGMGVYWGARYTTNLRGLFRHGN